MYTALKQKNKNHRNTERSKGNQQERLQGTKKGLVKNHGTVASLRLSRTSGIRDTPSDRVSNISLGCIIGDTKD
jgi:hypothetical protein